MGAGPAHLRLHLLSRGVSARAPGWGLCLRVRSRLGPGGARTPELGPWAASGKENWGTVGAAGMGFVRGAPSSVKDRPVTFRDHPCPPPLTNPTPSPT